MRFNVNAPGCWGSAITNNPSSEKCKSCPFLKMCSKKVAESLLEIHKDTDVSKLIARYEVKERPKCANVTKKAANKKEKVKIFELSDKDIELISSLPKKSGKVVEQLLKKGINLKVEIRSGENPFNLTSPAFMKSPCKLLIESGQFTKRDLINQFNSDFSDWSAATLKSHTNISLSTLKALNVVEHIDNLYRIKE